MKKVIMLTSIDDVLALIKEQKFDENVNRYRSSYLYRGLVHADYCLATSLYRNCKEKQNELEECILRNFSKYASMEDPLAAQSVWRQMIVGQHHGLPTRLLDWTSSPLIGLHFATSGEDFSRMETYDAALWKIDSEELNSLLPLEYQQVLKRNNAGCFTTDMLDSVSSKLKDFDNLLGKKSLAILEPPSIDQRIINQYSFFTIVPISLGDIESFLENNTKNTVKYVIAKEIKWQIRDILDQMNVSERMIYPGLDGLSMWLKRYYYVKPLQRKQ